MQCPKMIFGEHSCIIPSPEQLRVSPHLPLGSCSSDDGRRCKINDYYHSSNQWGPNTNTGNATTTSNTPKTAQDARQASRERWAQRVGETKLEISCCIAHQATPHKSLRRVQHVSSTVPVGRCAHQKGWCFFLGSAKPDIQTQNQTS